MERGMDLHGCGKLQADGTGVNYTRHLRRTYKTGHQLVGFNSERNVFSLMPYLLAKV